MKLARRIGHRGLAAFAPENTLAGIRLAHARGLRWVEIDVRLSADNVAVLSHDVSLLRCGGVRISVKNKTAAALAAVPVGVGFSGAMAREGVPSLAAAFALSRKLQIGMVVELKPDDGNESAAACALADVLHYASHRIVVSSFSTAMLAAVRAKTPEIARAYNCGRADDSAFAMLQKTGAENLHCAAGSSHRAIRRFADAGVGVYCFTVDRAETAKKLYAAGAHGIFTNNGLFDLDLDLDLDLD